MQSANPSECPISVGLVPNEHGSYIDLAKMGLVVFDSQVYEF